MSDDRSRPRAALGALDTWESGKPRAGRLAAPAADLRGRRDLNAGEVVTVERAAGGLVEACDIRGRPLALVAADVSVDLLDVDPTQSRAVALEVAFLRVLGGAAALATALRRVSELETRGRSPARGGAERGRLLEACEKFAEAAARAPGHEERLP